MDAGGSFGVCAEGGPGAASGAAAEEGSVPREAAEVSSLAPPCALARRAGGVAARLGGAAGSLLLLFDSNLSRHPVVHLNLLLCTGSSDSHNMLSCSYALFRSDFCSETIGQINE